jgi:hypothetical protein
VLSLLSLSPLILHLAVIYELMTDISYARIDELATANKSLLL